MMAALQNDFGVRGLLRHDEPLAKYTSWRVGGPADIYFEPADIADLQQFLNALPEDQAVHWIGLGSNLLIRDGGVRGAVVSTHGVFGELEKIGDKQIRAGAGVACAKLARQAIKWNLDGADFFAGIPGTVGGALAMNAGAFGGETWPHVVRVTSIDRRGRLHDRDRAEYRVGYRSVEGPNDEWFVSGVFEFSSVNARDRDGIKALLKRRGETQPIGLPSCGSVFRNPPGDHAARLIESAGLKGHRIGGAEVSTKHANFIINAGKATADEIEGLIVHVQSTVREATGVELIPEVRILGERS